MGNETPKIHGQEATVTIATPGGGEEELHLTLANPDLVRWDLTRHQHKWPTMDDAPMLWATFVCWHAAKRLGLTDVKFDQWRDEVCLGVVMPQEGEQEVDPTR